MEKYEIK